MTGIDFAAIGAVAQGTAISARQPDEHGCWLPDSRDCVAVDHEWKPSEVRDHPVFVSHITSSCHMRFVVLHCSKTENGPDTGDCDGAMVRPGETETGCTFHSDKPAGRTLHAFIGSIVAASAEFHLRTGLMPSKAAGQCHPT